jgi:hypothetical protein
MLGPLFIFRSFYVWFFFKSWSFKHDPFRLIFSMPSLPSPLLVSSPLSLINLWSCFSLINFKSSIFFFSPSKRLQFLFLLILSSAIASPLWFIDPLCCCCWSFCSLIDPLYYYNLSS